IDYLNCYPFFYHMLEKQPLADVHVTAGYPEELNRLMQEGELALSPVSAAAYADLQPEAVLLPEFCLSSIGYVGSVILASHVPIEELDGKRVGISSASRTSQVLVKILLERYYGLSPRYCQIPPRPCMQDLDAALIIGNDAMVSQPEPISYIYDIGDLWMRKTGHPVVFAVFAVRQEAIGEEAGRIRDVVCSFRRSLGSLEAENGVLLEHARKKYPDVDYDIQSYYRLLRFDFSGELKDALCYYFQAAAAQGLLAPVPALRFWNENSQGDTDHVCR
ncbi:MAG TPA: menaquinone biosynthesis protein, partial [Desulfosalsimonadaceae bacterium]|nr:menaquinone biosynthesis protein [Desulfosalsimonadaceae bacterium]